MSGLIEFDVTDDAELRMIQQTGQRLQVAEQFANAMCQSSLLPEHLRAVRKSGKLTALSADQVKANCIMIFNQALQWGVNPLSILPSTFVIGGNLGFDGKLIAAIVNKLGNLEKKLSYQFDGEGENLTVTVSGHIKGEDEPRTISVSVKEAKTDNQMWRKDPQQKLVYTGATRWARRHCPEVLLGIASDDEPVTESVDASNWSAPQTQVAHIEHQATESVENELSVPQIIERFKSEINQSDDLEELERIVSRVDAELVLPEPAREDLKALARKRYSIVVSSATAEPAAV